ncbi:DMT family transporter [Alteribacillus sp. HJP-4]|uniref:EamA family transporter n=1 Tax=Alteribacillus sp. HJP-4 TaxID=2775394 RepID=UPI0035CD025A
MSRTKAYAFAISGAALWGLTGLFVQFLYDYGFTPWQVVAIRAIFSGLLIVSYLSIFNPSYLKINLRDLPFFIGTGIISIVFFNWCFFTVIDETSISLAVVLLYTGPFFVTLLSRFLFKEWLTKRKVAALFVTIAGCAFTVGLLPSFNTSVSGFAIITGIGSGFFYALYSIFGKYVSRKYHSLTITAWSFICASTLMLPAGGLLPQAGLFLDLRVLFFAAGLALIPTVLAYIFYTIGLTYIESSRASILSTIEPVVALFVGFAVFGDQLGGWQMAGAALVLSSIFLVSEKKRISSSRGL